VGLVESKAGIVTGAASGIGRATALCFAEEGAAVVVADLESQRPKGEETVGLIEEAGGRAIFVAADVTSDDDQRRLVEECVSAFGKLDFAHNNAGIAPIATLEGTEPDVWDACLAVNLKGVYLGMRHQLPQMRKQGGGGAIINTSSAAGLVAMPGIAAYVASKFGVVGLTKAAAIEAGDAGIRVNCICLTTNRTAMNDFLPDEFFEQVARSQAIKRPSRPREVAETVVWLASERASLFTGVAFPNDLGLTAGFQSPEEMR
jgi:NAD(P)-dependent dehydrogenase (short-subunit alcohol dehydrogenase family)